MLEWPQCPAQVLLCADWLLLLLLLTGWALLGCTQVAELVRAPMAMAATEPVQNEFRRTE